MAGESAPYLCNLVGLAVGRFPKLVDSLFPLALINRCIRLYCGELLRIISDELDVVQHSRHLLNDVPGGNNPTLVVDNDICSQIARSLARYRLPAEDYRPGKRADYVASVTEHVF